MKQIIVFIFLSASIQIYSQQNDTVFFVDYLELTREEISNLYLHPDELKFVKSVFSEKDNRIETYFSTKILIVFDGTLLTTQKSKAYHFVSIRKNAFYFRYKKEDFTQIYRIGKERAIDKYGKAGRNGAVIVNTKHGEFLNQRYNLSSACKYIVILDGLNVDYKPFIDFFINKYSVKQIVNLTNHKNYCDTIFVHTKIPIFLNGIELNCLKKIEKLSQIKTEDIDILYYMGRYEAIEKYGKKGKYGVLIMELK